MPDTTADTQAARDELAAANARHKELIGMGKRRVISLAAFAEMEPAIVAEIKAAEGKLRDLERPSAIRDLLGDGPAEDVGARWKAATVPARREVVRRVFARLAVRRAAVLGQAGDVSARLNWHWAE